jgi:hypothetical protein
VWESWRAYVLLLHVDSLPDPTAKRCSVGIVTTSDAKDLRRTFSSLNVSII